MDKKIIVIGGGSAGCSAALEAARSGCEVELWEKDLIGGVCLNYGCIPTKALLNHTVKQSAPIGRCTDTEWNRMRTNISAKIDLLRQGMERQLARAGVKIERKELNIGEIEEDAAVIYAAGKKSAETPGVFQKHVFGVREVLELETIPARLDIIGGGAIGIEYAQVFAALGCDVTVWEQNEMILNGFSKESAERYMHMCMEQGIRFELGRKVSPEELDESIFIANGLREGYSKMEKDAFEAAGVAVCEKGIVTDAEFETTRKGFYAVGDCTGKTSTAYDAERAARHVVKTILGKDSGLSDVCVRCICGKYDLVSAGNLSGRTAEANCRTNAYAFMSDAMDSYAVVYCDEVSGELNGVELMAPHASESVGLLSVLIENRVNVRSLAAGVYFHPGINECIREAAVRLSETLRV